VILDVGELKKHVNVGNLLFQLFYNIGLRFFYFILGLVTDKIIVFEQELKNRLVALINPAKIEVLSLAVKERKGISLAKAKRALGIPSESFVLLVFGFINGYKGIDWIINKVAKLKSRKLRLLIAGGKNPYLTGKPHYERFYRTILEAAAKDKRVITTGFIPDSQIGLYFSATDLVVLPYEVFMSASGPLSWAMAYQKPVIFSEKLYDYGSSEDFQETMREVKIHSQDLFFRFDEKSFLKLYERIAGNKKLYRKLIKFSSTLAKERKIEKVGQRYGEITEVAPRVAFLPAKTRIATSSI
jgi:glycosyltransferase involved in cell wall biosynthesis